MSSLSESSILSGASGTTTAAAAHQVSQSIRFNQEAKSFMHRSVPGSAVGATTSTISMWVKIGGYAISAGTTNYIMGAFYGSNGRYGSVTFTTSGQLQYYAQLNGASTSISPSPSYVLVFQTNRLFRDISAWYHLLLVHDTTQDEANERVRLYVNGEREEDFSSFTPGSKDRTYWFGGTGYVSAFGAYESNASYAQNLYFDGYMSDICLISGTAYGPETFGEFDTNGIWRPIAIDTSSISFGAQGAYLNGSSGTPTDDQSGNGNNYTAVNLDAHDIVKDTPTNNFCILNSLDKYSYDSGQTVRGVRDQGLSFVSKPAGNQNGFGAGNMAVKSGKWYYELYTTTYPSTEAFGFGYADVQDCATATASPTRDFGLSNRHTGSAYSSWFWGTSSSVATGLTPFQNDKIIGVYTDFDNNEFKIYVDGSLYGSVDFDSTSPTDNLTIGGIDWVPRFTLANDQVAKINVNFGQDDSFNGNKTSGSAAASDDNGFGKFYYTPLSGYLAICSRNLGA